MFSAHSPLILLQGIGALAACLLGLVLSYTANLFSFFPSLPSTSGFHPFIHSLIDLPQEYLQEYYIQNPLLTSDLYFNAKKISSLDLKEFSV